MQDWRQPIRPPIKHTFDGADDIRLHGMSAAFPQIKEIEASQEEVIQESNEPVLVHAFD